MRDDAIVNQVGARKRLFDFESEGFRLSRDWQARHTAGPQGASHSDTAELVIMEEGQQIIDIDGARHRIGTHQWVLLPPGCPHSSVTEARNCTDTILHVPLRHLDAAAAALGLGARAGSLPAGVYQLGRELQSITRLLEHYPKSVPEGDARRLLVDSLLAHLSLFLVERHLGARAIAPEPGALPARGGIIAAEAAMRRHLDQPHPLDALARTAGLSRFHFLRLFKRTFGAPPHLHLVHLRVAEAARLLASSKMSATAVAYAVGFASASNLSAAFVRLHGTTPDRWRRQQRGWATDEG